MAEASQQSLHLPGSPSNIFIDGRPSEVLFGAIFLWLLLCLNL